MPSAVSLEEVLLSTEDQVEAQVRLFLRPGEKFTIELQNQCWAAEITVGDGDDFKYLWDSLGYDRRLLLLDAFGWLWTRNQATQAPPLWSRRQEVTREAVARRALREPFPDPEDLDPVEVRSVYEQFHRHGKKG